MGSVGCKGVRLCGEALGMVQARMATRHSSHRRPHSADGVLWISYIAAGACGVRSNSLWGHWGGGCWAQGVKQGIPLRPVSCILKHRSSQCEESRKRSGWHSSRCPSRCCKDVSVTSGGDAIVYSLGATRCIILHLATSESLQHAMGGEDGSLMLCGLTVALVSLALVQVTCSAFSGASPGVTPSLQQQQHEDSLRHAMGRQKKAVLCHELHCRTSQPGAGPGGILHPSMFSASV